MDKIILFIKSYKGDLERVKVLLQSIKKYNRDAIPVYLSVNNEDYNLFSSSVNLEGIHLLRDKDIIEVECKDGWRYQQIVKSNVYRLGICENYLCLDSDSEFIRDFYISDFMYDDDTPYTIMHESKGYLEMMEGIGQDANGVFFKQALEATRSMFKNKGKLWDYGPSPYLWSCKVWRHFNEVYLKDREMTFVDFFNAIDEVTSPSECVIYGEYLLKTRLIDILPVEGFFKVYHYPEQYDLEKKYLKEESHKKIYLGVIKQSNWKKKKWYKIF